MKITINILSIFCMFLALPTSAQYSHQLFKQIGGPGAEVNIGAMTQDEDGNIYITGHFKGTVDFDDDGINDHEASDSAGDAYLVRYNKEGTLTLFRAFSSNNEDNGTSIRVDQEGNIYVAGIFKGTSLIIEEDKTSETLKNEGARDVFIVKYDSNGLFKWKKHIGGAGDSYFPILDVAGSGNVYIGGEFVGEVKFKAKAGVEPTLSSKVKEGVLPEPDVFWAKYVTQGENVEVDFARVIGGLDRDNFTALKLDQNENVYVSGNYRRPGTNPGDFTPTENIHLLPDAFSKQPNIFLAKFSSEGESIRLEAFGGDGRNISQGLYMDPNGSIYLTGRIDSAAMFAPDIPPIGNNNDVFIARYTQNLDYDNLSKSFGSSNVSATTERGLDIVTDKEGNIYLAGEFETRKINFGPSSDPTYELTGNTDESKDFWVKFDPAGIPIFSQLIDSDGTDDFIKFIRTNAKGNVFLAGYFNSPIDFGGQLIINPKGVQDVYIVKALPITTPEITDLSLSDAMVGDTMTITGKNFGNDPEQVTVDFDSTGNSDFISLSDTAITLTVPDLEAGTHEVSVRVGSTVSNKYEFDVVVPIIKSVLPLSALPGEQITITGKNFRNDPDRVTVYFDEIDIPFIQVNDTVIILNVPEEAAGTYFVSVIVGTTDSNKDKTFTIVVPQDPILDSLSVQSAFSGDIVTLYGQNFGKNQNEVTVVFVNADSENEEIPVIAPVLIDTTTIKIVVPQVASGLYDMVVIIDDVRSNPYSFTVNPASSSLLEINGINPPFGNKNTVITITGNNFGTTISNVKVTFNQSGESVSGEIEVEELNNTEITVNVPDNLEDGAYNIGVMVDDMSAVYENEKFVLDNTPPIIDLNELPVSGYYKPGESKEISINVTEDGVGIKSVEMRYFGIREDGSQLQPIRKALLKSSNNTFTVDISDISIADELGIEYYFEAVDSVDNKSDTAITHLLLFKDHQSFSISASAVNNSDKPEVSDYNLVALPITENSRDQVFGNLGTFGKEEDWWLWEYNANAQSYSQVISGSAILNPKKAYMLIYRKSAEMPVQGKVMSFSPDEPVAITLAPGANLIGNPFPFNISWAAVLAANQDVEGIEQIGSLRNFSQGNWPQTSQLDRLKGVCVFNANTTPITLVIPHKKSPNGRIDEGENRKKPMALDATSWEVPLRISTGERYATGSIGMQENAKVGYDPSDDFTVPRFIDYLELNFHHPEFFLSKFAKDIVPTQEAYTWEFEVTSNLTSSKVTLQWENHYFGNNEQELMLLDLHNHQIINMQETASYRFSVIDGTRAFKVFYGNEAIVKENMFPVSISVGEGFPNPMSEQISIPFSLPKSGKDYSINMMIYSLTGQLVKKIEKSVTAGYHTLQWDRKNHEGKSVNPGLYFYRMQVNDHIIMNNGRIVVK